MSGDNSTADNTSTTEPPNDGSAGSDSGDIDVKNFDAVSAMDKIHKQNRENANLRARMKELETKSTELDQLKAAQMSDLEKAQAELAELKARNAELAMNQLREKVAKEAELPEGFAGRLQGTDEETLKADAEALKAMLPKTSAGARHNLSNLTSGSKPSGDGGQPGMDDWMRQKMNSR